MSNIGLKCDVCGIENVGVTFVNGMKFCAKCYQETFRNNTSQFVDLLHKEMYELKISDLEAKLADKDLRIEELESQFAYECECNKQFVDCQKENEQLKQQLAESEEKLKSSWYEICPSCGNPYGASQFVRENGEVICSNCVKIEDIYEPLIAQLEQQLAEKDEQLENAIVPKFKKGQEVWFVYDDSDTWDADYNIFHKKVMSISYNNYEGDHFEYAMSDDGTRDTIWYGYIDEKFVFATKEEALAKLKELGEKYAY